MKSIEADFNSKDTAQKALQLKMKSADTQSRYDSKGRPKTNDSPPMAHPGTGNSGALWYFSRFNFSFYKVCILRICESGVPISDFDPTKAETMVKKLS
jgi:hypothetical protein